MTIRRIPEDFVVREVLGEGVKPSPVRSVPDRLALYRLTKTSLTTPEASSMLAGVLGVRPAGVTHAGLKDKHACCVQHVTVEVKGDAPPAELVRGERWEATLAGWLSRPLTAADIDRNEFEIVVRDLLPKQAAEMERRAGMLTMAGDAEERGTTLGFINYFGDQRFGSARHGKGFAAALLVKGDFEGALRLLIGTPARKDSGARRGLTRAMATHWGAWKEAVAASPRNPERRPAEVLAAGGSFVEAFEALPRSLSLLCVEAFQSYLWNAVARGMCEERFGASGTLLTADDSFGAMHFPRAQDLPAEWLDMRMPLLNPGADMNAPWGETARRVMESHGIALHELRVPGCGWLNFRGVERPLVVRAQGLTLSAMEADDLGRRGRVKRSASFSLPRGAYATTLLRALGQ
jgi:tRNA pseudouridine13 synthase